MNPVLDISILNQELEDAEDEYQQGLAEGFNFDDKKGRWEWDDGTSYDVSELTPAQKERVAKWKAANPGKRQGRVTPDTRGEHTPHGSGAGPRVFEQGVTEEGYGNHPSQRVDPRTGKRYVPPKSPLGQGVAEEWSKKYKSSINCSHPKGFSQKAHCAGKKKHNEDMTMEAVCPDCGMCETHGDNMMEVKQRLDAKCWSGKHKEGTKIKGGIRVNNCVPNESVTESYDDHNPVVSAISRRIMHQRLDLLQKYGVTKVMSAIDEVADFVGDVEEIGSSDVSGWVRHVEQMLGNMGELDEDDTTAMPTTAPGAAPSVPGAAPATTATGAVTAQSPADIQKQKNDQRKALQDQITATTKQLADLRTQLASIQ